jgi:hypothetical protein
MVPITDGDIKNLLFIKDAAKTYEKMSEWTGFSATAISKWMKGDEFEMKWHKSVQTKMKKVRRDLDPKPKKEPVMAASPRVAVFAAKLDLYQQAMDIANMVKDVECERDALRLALRLKMVGE